MKAYIDIENAHTQEVTTLQLDVITSEEEDFVFDISKLTSQELDALKDAIDVTKLYTDIELFYLDDNNMPYFGPDYNFNIESDHLKGENKRKGR